MQSLGTLFRKMWKKNRTQNEKQASCIYISMYVSIYVSTLFTANFIYYRGWQEVTGEKLKSGITFDRNNIF